MASETDRNDNSRSPADESLDSLPSELQLYVPAEGTPVEQPAKPAEPSYEQVPLSSLSGAARPESEQAPAAEAPSRPAKGVGLPSKVSLIALAAAAVILVSVPFVIAVLVARDDQGLSDEPKLIDMNSVQARRPDDGMVEAPVPATEALPPTRVVEVPVPRETSEADKSVSPPEPPQQGKAPGNDTMIAGAGCPNTAKQQYQAVGFYSDGADGWYARNGGSAESGCKGTFDAMPMSGKANTSDSGIFAKWTFDVSDEMTVGSCALSVYIPNDSDRRNVGATAAHYSIFNSFDQGTANVIGAKDVNQVANRGKWVSLGSYDIDQGKLSVKLHNRGEDWAGGADGEGAHIAATQIRATCTPA